jgi:hypothetical protein
MSVFATLRKTFGYVLLSMGVSRPQDNALGRQSPSPHPEGPKPSTDSSAPPSASQPESRAARPGSHS